MIEDYFFDLFTLAPKFHLNDDAVWLAAINSHPIKDKKRLAQILLSYIDLILSMETFLRYDWGWLQSFLLKNYFYKSTV